MVITYVTLYVPANRAPGPGQAAAGAVGPLTGYDQDTSREITGLLAQTD